jgi:hypothetical protein
VWRGTGKMQTPVVLFKELFRVVVAVDVNFGDGIVDSGILATSLYMGL